jgi:ABC-type dipeptide/oligopeptide/nickel transport system ATPase subunit
LHSHRCDYASFLFSYNRIEKGRELFESALAVKMEDDDNTLRHIADTCLIWAEPEKSFNNEKEFKRLIKEAYAYAERIQHKEKSFKMTKLIDKTTHTRRKTPEIVQKKIKSRQAY